MISTLLFAAAIIGFIVILILFLAFISKRHRKMQAQKQELYFSKAASAFGLSVHKKDQLRHRIIGCDEQFNRVIFVDYSEEPYRQSCIELKNMAGSKLVVNNEAVTENVKGVDKVIDRFISSIQIKIQFKNNTTPPVILPVYEYGVDGLHDLEELKQNAETWSELINKNCGSN